MSLGLALKLANAPLFKGVGVDARYGIDIFAARSVGQTRFRNGLRSSSSLTDIATVTRATTAWGVDQAGVLSSFAAGQPVVTTAGLAVWEARTNLAIRSQEFDNAAWLKSGVTVTADAAVAPDGTTTADLLNAGVGNSEHAPELGVSVTSGSTYTLSVHAKAGTASLLFLWNSQNGSMGSVNLLTGAVTGAVTARPLANGWWRAQATFTASTTASRQVRFYVKSTAVYTGSNETLYVWGSQFEVGSSASPYIPTTTAAVTRNADQITETVNIPVGQAFTVLVKWVVPVTSPFGEVFRLSPASNLLSQNSLRLHHGNSNPTNALYVTGCSQGVDSGYSGGHTQVVTAGQVCAVAISVTGAVVTWSFNGNAPQTYTMPGGVLAEAMASLLLGDNLNSTIRDLSIVMRAYSSAELQAASDVSLVWDEDFTTQTYRYVGDPYLAVTDLPMTTFSRPSKGFGVNAAGLLIPFASGVPRATDGGLTVEAQATNILTASFNDPPGTIWNTVVDCAVAAGTKPCPIAGGTVANITTTNTNGWAQRNTTIVTGSEARTFSVFLEKKAVTWGVSIGCSGGTLISTTLQLNGLTGALTVGVGNISSYDANWWQVDVTVTNNSSVGNTTLYVYVSIIGAAGQTGDIALPDVEVGSFKTTYKPSAAGVPATRSADALASADTVISPTIVAEFTVPLTGPGYANVWSHSDVTSNHQVILQHNRSLGRMELQVDTGAVNQTYINLGSVTPGSAYKVAVRIATNDVAGSLSGAAVVADTSVTLPTVTEFAVGRRGFTSYWGEGIRKIKRYSVAKTNAELQALST